MTADAIVAHRRLKDAKDKFEKMQLNQSGLVRDWVQCLACLAPDTRTSHEWQAQITAWVDDKESPRGRAIRWPITHGSAIVPQTPFQGLFNNLVELIF